jgi:putative peptidoglycan lipid II flippase
MSIIRNISTVGTATLLSRVLALIRDMGVAAVLGASPLSDAYFVALQIPNLFRRLLAEGTVNGAFVPIWLRLRGTTSNDRAHSFGESVFGSAIIALGGFVLVCMALAPLVIHLIAPGFGGGERFDTAVEFLRLSIAYVAIAGVVAIASAILIAEGQVTAAAGSIVAFNVVLVIVVLIVAALGLGETQRSGEILAVSFVIAGIAQLALVSVALARLRQRPRQVIWKPSDEARLFYARALPALIAGGIPQLALIAGTIIASSSVAAVSWLYYAYRLYEVPLGVISVALSAVLAPRIAASVQAGTRSVTRQAQSQALELALGLALPAAAGLATLSLPIAGLLFERGSFDGDDTLAVAVALAVIVIGLPGHAAEKVLGAISFAHEDTRAPMHAALAGLAAAALLALLLVRPLGHVGIAAGVAIAGWVSSGWLFHLLRLRGQLTLETETLARLARIGMATAIMAVALIVLLTSLMLTAGRPVSTLGQIFTLVVLISAGLAIYAVSLQRFGIISLRELAAVAGLRA